MRTKEELENEIKKLEGRIWFIQMGDRWTHDDAQLVYKFRNEVKKMKEELKCLEENSSALSVEASV